jgi:hypothetical protein
MKLLMIVNIEKIVFSVREKDLMTRIILSSNGIFHSFFTIDFKYSLSTRINI